jgi:hypothetical protein
MALRPDESTRSIPDVEAPEVHISAYLAFNEWAEIYSANLDVSRRRGCAE